MTNEELYEIISQCYYHKPGWYIGFYTVAGDRPYIQLTVREPNEEPWKSGKRYLSPHMCRQEVVGSVFDLIKSAEMHEIHERFRYKGRSIYNPHLDPDALASLASKIENFNFRHEAMSMEEPE